MDILKDVPDNEYNLAIVDPPYGIGKSSVNGSGKLKNRKLNTDDISRWDKAPNQSYFNELRRVSKHQIIWGGNYFDLPPTRGVICWDKCQPWENFSQWEMAWTSYNKPASMYKYDNRTGGKIHPTEKPIVLYRWILSRYAKAGQKILDTHGGSFSSAIACHSEGFDLDIMEIAKEYFDNGVKRFRQETRQLKLF